MTELRSILHVECNHDIREITRMALEWADNFHVVQYASAQETLRQIGLQRPSLFLLHYSLPDMNGLKLWKQLYALDGASRIPCIFMTARAEPSLAEELYAHGALGVITKPFDPITLGDQLRQLWGVRDNSASPIWDGRTLH